MEQTIQVSKKGEQKQMCSVVFKKSKERVRWSWRERGGVWWRKQEKKGEGEKEKRRRGWSGEEECVE